MKRVQQTKFGDGEGNCLTACVASLLECEIDDLPDFSSFGKEWHHRTAAILHARGFDSIFVDGDNLCKLIVSDCLCVAIFDTGTHEDHAKLGRWTSEYVADDHTWSYRVEEVFDPNPYSASFRCVALRGLFLVFPSMEGYKASQRGSTCDVGVV